MFKNIFWQDTSGWLLLVFIYPFWEVVQMSSFLEYLWEPYFKYKLQDSAVSRCILVPFERYGRPKKCFFMYVSRKIKWNIAYKYLKNKHFFKRPKYPSPNALNIRYFWTLTYNYWGFEVSLSYRILNFKKMVCPKNVWMRHCRKTLISQVLHEHFIQEQEIAIRRLEAATRGVL